jgi:hypothetical protein
MGNSLYRIPRPFLKHLLLICACMNVSCAAYKETFENPDITCWKEGGFGGAIRCEAFISFQCQEDLDLLSGSSVLINKKIVTSHAQGVARPKVGEISRHSGFAPIFVKDASPWEILHKDTDYILRQAGFNISTMDEVADRVLEVDMTYLNVQTEPGRWFDLKVPLQAAASFKASLRRKTGEELWAREFVGKHQIMVSYFFLRDSEKTLGHAYCRALEKFSAAVRTSEFQENLQ